MLRLAFVAAVSALALSACAPQEQFKATLSGASEVPPTRSAGAGNAALVLNPSTALVTWTVNHANLSGPVTAGHLHGPAAPGANAGVVVPFTKVDASPITGSASLTVAQMEQLRSGLWYVNLHTAANPGGEIRGQVTQ